MTILKGSNTASVANTAVTDPDAEIESEEDEAISKRVLCKIDFRLMSLLWVTYNLNFMDKTILSSAAVFGLEEDTVSADEPRPSPIYQKISFSLTQV